MNWNFINKTFINQLAAVVLVVALASCSSGNAEDEGKSKQEQLVEYKQQAHELELKIAGLEKEIKAEAEVEYVPVVLTELESKKFEHFIEVTGRVEADQEVNVSPEGSGQIMEIKVREGQRVSKGTVLAVLNSGPIDRTIDQTEINLEMAKTTFNRQNNLWKQNIGSELQYLQAKSNKEALEKQLENLQAQKEMSIIKAPLSGTIDNIFQKEGQIASPQTPFAKLINIDKVKVYADLSETYLTKVDERDEVTVNFPAIDKTVSTKIQMVGNYVDPNNRTFRIRLDLQNNDKLIKPNLDAVVQVRDYAAENAIVVPSLLIKEDFKGHYTFIAEQDGNLLKAKKVYVEPGVTNNNMTEVKKGLKPGMKIISQGFSQVVDGSPVQPS